MNHVGMQFDIKEISTAVEILNKKGGQTIEKENQT
jgi:hypothetical protein